MDEGKALVTAARMSIEQYIKNPTFDHSQIKGGIRNFNRNDGIFVTLEKYPSKELRGCIGFPWDGALINDTLVEATIAAAFQDPRFDPVSKKELDKLTIEISILSQPVIIDGNASKRKASVKVGRDGLIVEYGVYSGLLLPIVPVERGWDVNRFMEETCMKAGLPETYWRQQNVRLWKFESQIFREEAPGAKVIEVNLSHLFRVLQ